MYMYMLGAAAHSVCAAPDNEMKLSLAQAPGVLQCAPGAVCRSTAAATVGGSRLSSQYSAVVFLLI